VNDVARTAAEDGEILVLAVHRRARVAAVLMAADVAPEIPAPRPLAEIAAERPHVAKRRRPDGVARLHESREPLADDVVPGNIAQSSARADAHDAV
jgi:hypothetical protein